MSESDFDISGLQSFSVDAQGQRLLPARWCPSPNFDARPPGARVELLVVHCISLPPGEFGTGCVHDLFLNRLDHQAHPYFEGLRELRVSAHLFVDRAGCVSQFVALRDRAWHAGVSHFQGRERCNDFSIGVELEGTDSGIYSDAQYQTLIALSRCLFEHFPALDSGAVVGHSDIAPGRKTDPGPGFDWVRLKRALPR
ncbi:MAG: 1,6-anhydro-N-acetylmuramyl-L-alanine amidase AmpD [Gammaproteobacteria bacterium]|nr:1,6-anhydro-N-acetylmuramyl-L-alanine amidase AmpD [Gammaproteobacteria bacterium]